MNGEELQEILKIFRAEARDVSRRLTEDLIALEGGASADAGERYERVLRDTHTLKGSAASLGFGDVSTLMHVAESILVECRAGSRKMDRVVVDAILDSLDRVNERVELEVSGTAGASPGILRATENLEAVRAGRAASVLDRDIRGRAGPTEFAAPAPSSTLQVTTDRVEEISSLADELLFVRLRVGQRVMEAKALAEKLSARVRQTGTAEAGLGSELRRAAADAAQLAREIGRDVTRLSGLGEDLHEAVRSLQIVPARTVFDSFRRSVREHARRVGIDVAFEISDADVSADRRILEAVRSPVMHLLRNAIDHGLEPAAERRSAGKEDRGRLDLEVSVVGSRLRVVVRDDGRGLNPERIRTSAASKGVIAAGEASSLSDEEALALIWRAGFSTSAELSETSGRGVGLDAVREDVVRLSGQIELTSAIGKGTSFVLSFPLRLTSAAGLVVESDGSSYLLPMTSVEAILRLQTASLLFLHGHPVLMHLERAIPAIRLSAALTGVARPLGQNERILVCVVSDGTQQVALVVDQILGESEMSLRPLGPELQRYEFLGGASRTADGKLLLVLSASGLVQRALSANRTPAPVQARVVLVADDSVSTQLLYRAVLEAAGYQVLLAGDGLAGLDIARAQHLDAVVSDVRMPKMDGLEFTRQLRRLPGMAELPILIVSSLASDEDRQLGLRAGATAYLVKSETPPGKVVDVLSGFVS